MSSFPLKHPHLVLLLLVFLLPFTIHSLTRHSTCTSTPYPQSCLSALKLSLSLNISISAPLLLSLEAAFLTARRLSSLFSSAFGNSGLVETQKGAISDCYDLHYITLDSLQKSLDWVRADSKSRVDDARVHVSAALTNKDTCLEGLGFASGPLKPVLVGAVVNAYRHVSNSLSMISRIPHGRRLLEKATLPRWLHHNHHQILNTKDDSGQDMLVVAVDGSGNFSTIREAIEFAPNNSEYRTIIYIKAGVYEENVEIPSYKTNIVLLGDGKDATAITGTRSVGDGWTTFRSATVAVSGAGFLARDITFINVAGPKKHQAVALRINADLAAVYRCTIIGYQDTLYVHTFRQFYRECDIYGTIDFIFGNAAVVFQACNIISRMPLPGQFTVITAQSRDTVDEDGGIIIQNCTILADDYLLSNSTLVKSYLGRPWKEYSRTVYMKSYIDGFVAPEGWTRWEGDQGLETVYYGEYSNNGPGSGTDNRVTWPGYHVMEYEDALEFTVSEFIMGDEWLESTSFPYDDGI